MRMWKRVTLIPVLFLMVVVTLAVIEWRGGGVAADDPAAEEEAMMAFIGEAEISVRPDVVYIYLGVETEAETAREAQLKNAESMVKVFENLEKIGLKKESIETTSFHVEPVREYISKSKKWVTKGYRAVNAIKITLTDLEKTGEVIDVAVEGGSNTVQNIVFAVKDESQWKLKALEAAAKDARAKAETVAAALGIKLTGIKYVSDREADVIIQTRDMGKMYGAAVVAESGGPSTPIEAGDVKVHASVEVHFIVRGFSIDNSPRP